MPLTLEEQERRAYISGDVALARVLADRIDNESEALDEAEHELRIAREQNDTLQQAHDDLEEQCGKHEDRIAELERQVENLQAHQENPLA